MKILMKRIIAVLASMALTASSTATIFAAETDGLEDAVLSVKSVIDIPDELSEFSGDIVNDGDKTMYELSWHMAESDNLVSVTLTEGMGITGYYLRKYDDYSRESIGFAKLGGEELKAKSVEWLKKVNPSLLAELPEDKFEVPKNIGIHGNNAYIRADRYVNGIRFLNDGVRLTLDKNTGEVKRMTAEWSDKKDLPNVSEAIDKETANSEFLKLSPIELIYMNDDGDNIARPVYVLTSPYVYMNGKTGEELNNAPTFSETEDAAGENGAMGGASSSKNDKLTESELKNIEIIASLKSEDELKAAAAALDGTGLSEAEYNGISYRKIDGLNGEESELPEYTAELSFTFDKGTEKAVDAYVTFNAKNGELINYYAAKYQKSERELSEEEAQKTSDTFVKNYGGVNPENIGYLSCEYNKYGNKYLTVFDRWENGIRFPQDRITVSVDAENGRVLSYYKSWSKDIKFENAENIINATDAEEKIKNNLGLELSYEYSYSIGEDGKAKKKIELAYSTPNDLWIGLDAVNGEFIREDNEKSHIPTDIKGHYAENRIVTLINNGIAIAEDENFRPDDVISIGELAAFAAVLKNGSYVPALAEAKENLLSLGILLPSENYNPDAPATRADGAAYIIRALGYRKPAELKKIYRVNFADGESIPEEVLGYAALAEGFGIIKGDENGFFNGDNPLTRADAAIMLYNSLSN